LPSDWEVLKPGSAEWPRLVGVAQPFERGRQVAAGLAGQHGRGLVLGFELPTQDFTT
jgi:hypothetical protein